MPRDKNFIILLEPQYRQVVLFLKMESAFMSLYYTSIVSVRKLLIRCFLTTERSFTFYYSPL